MKAVIFGGSGFLGQHLARSLVKRGATQVLIADIAPPRYEIVTPIQFVTCDVRKEITFQAPAEAHVFNLAAVHRTPGHPDHEYFDTNVAGAANVAAFCERLDIEHLVFTSSISIYGPSEAPVTEATVPRPAGAYGASKLEAEHIHTTWASSALGRRLVIVRPGTVFGPGERGNFTRLASALAKRRFVYPGRRDTVKACGYVADLVESLSFVQALSRPVVTYNFGLPQPPTIEDVCRAFCRVGGFPQPRLVVPTPIMLGASKLLKALGASSYSGERILKLVRSTWVIPQVLIDEAYPYRFSLESALADWYASGPPGAFV